MQRIIATPSPIKQAEKTPIFFSRKTPQTDVLFACRKAASVLHYGVA